MSFLIVRLFLVGAVLAPLTSFAQEVEVKTKAKNASNRAEDLPFKILGHMDLNITRIDRIDGAGFGLHGGVVGVYKIGSFVGVHLGAQFSQIAASENNVDINASYVDVPFGLSFAYKNLFQGSTNYMNIGGFFGIPAGDFEISGQGSGVFELENMLGFNFDTHTVWPVSEKLKIGIHAFLKFGLKGMVEVDSTNPKYYAVGLGVSGAFL